MRIDTLIKANEPHSAPNGAVRFWGCAAINISLLTERSTYQPATSPLRDRTYLRTLVDKLKDILFFEFNLELAQQR